MSERYVRLYTCDAPQVQGNAPVMLAAGVLLGDKESGRVLAQLKLQNISEKAIKAVYVRLQCMDVMNVVLPKLTEAKYMDFTAAPGSSFGDRMPILLDDASARSFTLQVTDVMFDDGISWHNTSDESFLTVPAIPSALTTEQLEQLRIETNYRSCSTSPAEWQHVKRCACGQWNLESNTACVHCGLHFEELVSIATPLYLDPHYAERKKQEAEEAEAARIRAAKEAEAREQERKRIREQQEKEQAIRKAKKKKLTIISAAAAVVAITIILLVTNVFVPMKKYSNAVKLLEDGQYTDAMAAFETLGDYSDSSDRVKQAEANIAFDDGNYQKVIDIYAVLPEKYLNHADDLNEIYTDAIAQMEAGNYDTAIYIFTLIGNYQDSATQRKEAAYRKAGALAADGDFNRSREIYNELIDYNDSATLLVRLDADELYHDGNFAAAYDIYATLDEVYQIHRTDYETMYATAASYMKSGSYDEARAQFTALGNYGNSAAMVHECDYQEAKGLAASGNYDVAIDLYDTLLDYKNSAALMTQAEADKLFDAGSYAEAYDIYAALNIIYQTHAADYRKMYKTAEGYLAGGSYDEARAQFAALGNYSNSAAMVHECDYQEAKGLAVSGNYGAAINLYDTLIGYKDSAALMTQAEADMLYDAGSYAEAYDIYATLNKTYQTHAADYEAMYASAAQALKDKDYDNAHEQFVALGNYSDASTKAAQCGKDKANTLFDAGRYDEAAEAYAAIGDEEKAKLSIYHYAAQMAENGEYKLAADAYFSITDYEDSREQHYQMGLQARANNKLTDACSILNEDIDYRDAKEIIYQMGVTASNEKLYEASVPCFTAVGAYKDATMKLTMDTYAWGNQLYDNGSYAQSAEVFISMGDFSDAATRANEASYAAAEASMNAGDYDVAAKRFAALKDYKDSAEMVKECDYRSAIKLFNDGKYVSAKAAFFALDGYSDSISMAKQCNYQLAQEAMAREDYENAAFLFDSAGTYSNSEAQAAECRRLAAVQKGEEYESHNAYVSAYTQYALANETDKMAEMAYQTAMSKMTASDYAGAIQWFEKAGYGYNDVNEQILSIGEYYFATQQYDAAEAVYVKVVNTGVAAQRLYELGQYYELAGDVEHAAKAYGEAENYEDASAKAKAMQMEADYRAAESLYGTGNYKEAKAIYAEIAGYKDADSKLAACVKATTLTVGTYVEFGTYPQTKGGEDSTPIEWLVLAIDDSKVLLISRYGLDVQPYNQTCVATTWEKCTLRTWLNTTFLTKAFTAEERQAILTTTVDNSRQGYKHLSTNGGNNTQDKIFLLSYAEANEYFGVTVVNNRNIKARVTPTAYAAEQGELNLKYSSKSTDGMRSCKWWLRSPGNKSSRASYVDRDGSLYYTEVDKTCCCVRPALWVNLESVIF